MADTSPPKRRGCLFPVILIILGCSLLANFILGYVLVEYAAEALNLSDSESLNESFVFGDKDADDKIAIVNVKGLISESGIAYPIQQLEAAAKDKYVKAVVLRIDSPGGLVTASDELYH